MEFLYGQHLKPTFGKWDWVTDLGSFQPQWEQAVIWKWESNDKVQKEIEVGLRVAQEIIILTHDKEGRAQRALEKEELQTLLLIGKKKKHLDMGVGQAFKGRIGRI